MEKNDFVIGRNLLDMFLHGKTKIMVQIGDVNVETTAQCLKTAVVVGGIETIEGGISDKEDMQDHIWITNLLSTKHKF